MAGGAGDRSGRRRSRGENQMRAPLPGILLALLAASPARADAAPPITGLTLDWSTFRQLARGSDNWATTWAADGSLYAGFGDGNGFQGGRQSLGFARLTGGSAQAVQGTDLPGTPAAGKTYGVLALGDTLYAFVSPGSNAANYQEARLYRAPPGGGPWTRAGWAFTDRGPERLVLPAFLQDGRGYAGGGPWVYAYAPRYAPRTPGRLSIQDGTGPNGIVLMRAPRDGLMDRGSWQFFAGLGQGGPLWSADPGGLRPVLNSAAGVGWTVSAIHDRGLGRYLLATEYGRSFAGRIALYEAAHPWGPWDLAARLRLEDPGGRAGTRTFYANILPNTLSADGKGLTLAFTGTGDGDALNLVDGRLVLGGAPAPQGSAPAAQRRALLKGAARRGAAVVADALRQARQGHAGTGLDAAAPAFGLDDPSGGERLGLAVFPVGQAAPADPASSGDPARAGFERAYGPDASEGGGPGGVGVEYGLPGGTRLGVVVTSRGDAAPGGAGLASQDGMAAYLRQRLGALRLDTSFTYSRDEHQTDG